ncbi:MAG: hypothetical protein Ct9H90mP13_01440 [Pseudomonadota bacterium]|nr:MAG: hypothetical protein Ct9H90mP13_01440 [Pseudomonadota bacterium]
MNKLNAVSEITLTAIQNIPEINPVMRLQALSINALKLKNAV